MGRPPSNGGPSFRFNPTEVVEMEAILQAHNLQMPAREILVALAEKFSVSGERSGKVVVQMKQVWNWFQNRRYALRAKAAKIPVKAMPRDDLVTVRSVPLAPQHLSVPPATTARNVNQVPQSVTTPSVQSAARNGSDSSQMEFEAKSARDGAWYDVANFLSHKSLETGDPEVLVRFAGFGAEEDEWVNIRKHVRQRSLPCEASECVAVLPGDLILCFQEGKEQALYFDAQVLDAQRRRHDVRGCRCRFLVRYDHDQSEEIVALRKVCRRPETDYRLQLLHAESANMSRLKTVSGPHMGNSVVYPPAEATEKQPKVVAQSEAQKQPKVEANADTAPVASPVPHASVPVTASAASMVHSSAPLANATTPVAHSNVSVATFVATAGHPSTPAATTVVPLAHSDISVAASVATAANSSIPGATTVAPRAHSDVSVATTTVPAAHAVIPGATTVAPLVHSHVAVAPTTSPAAHSDIPGATTVAVAPLAHSDVAVAATAAPAAPSSITGATIDATRAHPDVAVATTAAPAADSSIPGAATVAPLASDVPVVTEFNVVVEKVPGAGASENAENVITVSVDDAVASSTDDASVVSGGGSGQSMPQG